MRRASTVALSVAMAILGRGGAALANGRYPAASLIAFDPADPQHFVVSATFGLLESRDGGRTFLWACESALGSMGVQDLVVVVTASGATVTAKFDGIVTSSDGCSFHIAPELDQKNVVDMSLRRAAPHGVLGIYAESSGDGGFQSQIVESVDDGQTWTALGPALPADLYPLTIDVAPSDASRVYISARLSAADDYASALLRSTDGGATFERLMVPETAENHLAYIAAVHPLDPDLLYLRVYDPTGTRIWLSDDAGTTFRKVFTGSDQIYGFAVSPDGTELALGGPGDGIWIGPSDGSSFARRSDILPNCLGWTNDGIFACADEKIASFSVGRSVDHGATFEPLLRFDALCGSTGCGAGTEAAKKCPADWDTVARLLGTTCGTDGGTSDGAADGAAPDGGASNAETHPVPATDATGGSCSVSSCGPRFGASARWWVMALAAAACRRRRARHDQVVTIA